MHKNLLLIALLIFFSAAVIGMINYLTGTLSLTEYVTILSPALVLLIFFYNKLGIFLLVLTLPFSPRIIRFLDYNITVPEFLIAILISSILLRYMFKFEKPESFPYKKAIILFIIINFFSMGKSFMVSGVMGFFHSLLLFIRNWIELFLLTFIFYSVLKTEKIIKAVLILTVIVGFAQVFYAYLTFLQYEIGTYQLYELRFKSPNTFSLYLAQLLILAVCLQDYIRNFLLRIIVLFMIIGFCIFIFLTISRTGIICSILGVLVAVHKKSKLFFASAVFILIMLALSTFYVRVKFSGAFEKLNRYIELSNYARTGRFTILDRIGRRQIKSFFTERTPAIWFFGFGYYEIRINKVLASAHDDNTYLGVLARSGTLGLVSFIIIMISTFRILKKINARYFKGIISGYLSSMYGIFTLCVISGLTACIYYSPQPANLYWSLLGILFRIYQLSEKRKSEEILNCLMN